MRARIISAVIGLGVLTIALFGYATIVLNLVLSLISAIGVWELLRAFGYDNSHKSLFRIGIIFAAIIPLLKTPWFDLIDIKSFIFILIIVMFGILLKEHDSLRLEEVAVAFMMSISIPLSLSSLLFIRDLYSSYNYLSVFYILIALGAAWLADSGAYFAGRFLGKHKLAPTVSPKKTVEGSIGGVISNAIFFVLLGFIYNMIFPAHQINYFNISLLGLLSAPVGMMGDLVFSVIKRQNNVKDFGSIMPGHGGVLDRFDSVVLTAPFVMLMLPIIPPVIL